LIFQYYAASNTIVICLPDFDCFNKFVTVTWNHVKGRVSVAINLFSLFISSS